MKVLYLFGEYEMQKKMVDAIRHSVKPGHVAFLMSNNSERNDMYAEITGVRQRRKRTLVICGKDIYCLDSGRYEGSVDGSYGDSRYTLAGISYNEENEPIGEEINGSIGIDKFTIPASEAVKGDYVVVESSDGEIMRLCLIEIANDEKLQCGGKVFDRKTRCICGNGGFYIRTFMRQIDK